MTYVGLGPDTRRVRVQVDRWRERPARGVPARR
jgi:hypothetical protein